MIRYHCQVWKYWMSTSNEQWRTLVLNVVNSTRSLHSPVYSIWNGWIPTPFHGLHMDYFLAGNPAIFSFHTHHGVHMESIWNGPFHGHSMFQSMWIPCGFHGIFNEFTLKIYVLFHMDSMEESISNFVEEPSIVVSKIVSPSRIELSAPQHIKCASKAALLRLSHASVRR